MAVSQIVFLFALNFYYFIRMPVFFSLGKRAKQGPTAIYSDSTQPLEH